MKKNIILLMFMALIAATLYFSLTYPTHEIPEAQMASKDTELVPQSPSKLYGVSLEGMKVSRAVFQANENLGEVLSKYGVTVATIARISQLPKDQFNVKRLLANKPYTVIYPEDSSQEAELFVYHPNPIDYVAVHLGDSVSVEKGTHPVDTIRNTISGVITSSLYNAILESGGSPMLVNALADIYAWEIDFFGLQQGDCFKILYTTYEVDGTSAGFGNIAAASFTHYGKETYAFRYDQGEGPEYFDQEGNSLRKTFLKAPLTYSRISSRFSYSRLHPILKIRRPHLGVDYAAPRGTPVVAVGEGVITKASWGGGGGKTVKIKHNGNYQTAYLHLSRYGQGIKVGTSVSQGQVIGYVGSTGLSTGPHLDFRFYKNGRAVDPLKVDPPSANPIKNESFSDFQRISQSYMRKLLEIGEDQPLKQQLFLAKHTENNSLNKLNQTKPIQQ